VAQQRDEIFKQKVNDCVQHITLQVHQFRRNSVMEFQNICNEMVAPFFAPPVHIIGHRVVVPAKSFMPLGNTLGPLLREGAAQC